MQLRLRYILIFILIIIVVIDIFLLFVYLNIEKKINVSDPSFRLKQGEIKIREGNVSESILATVVFEANITKKPTLDISKNIYILPVEIDLGKKRQKINIIIGRPENNIPFLLTNKDSGDNLNWRPDSIKNIVKYLIPNSPIIIELFYEHQLNRLINKPGCNKECKESLIELSGYFVNTELVLKKLMTNQLGQQVPNIGIVSSLIIYND